MGGEVGSLKLNAYLVVLSVWKVALLPSAADAPKHLVG